MRFFLDRLMAWMMMMVLIMMMANTLWLLGRS